MVSARSEFCSPESQVWKEKRSDDYSKNSLKVRVYMYLLPFGFEKADLLLGEFFNKDAVAEVSLESRY